MKRIVLLVITSALFLSTAAFGETITVSSDNMNGWTAATNYTDTIATISNTVPVGAPTGNGAFYGTTGMHGRDGMSPIGQSWIGTDAYNGIKLSQITKLEYWTYAFAQGVDATHFTREPFELYLFTYKTPDRANFRPLLFRPWGILSNEQSGNPWNQWIRVDALAGKCYDVSGNELVTASTPCWITLNLPDTGNTYSPKTLAEIIALYPDIVLHTPTTGWNNIDQVPTGSCVNFFAGGVGASYNWYINGARDMYNFSGYMDKFTIGINGIDTTYDFGSPVPEPCSFMAIAAGFIGLIGIRRKRS